MPILLLARFFNRGFSTEPVRTILRKIVLTPYPSRDGGLPETRYPLGLFSLLNIYQRLGPFVGNEINPDTETGFLEQIEMSLRTLVGTIR